MTGSTNIKIYNLILKVCTWDRTPQSVFWRRNCGRQSGMVSLKLQSAPRNARLRNTCMLPPGQVNLNTSRFTSYNNGDSSASFWNYVEKALKTSVARCVYGYSKKYSDYSNRISQQVQNFTKWILHEQIKCLPQNLTKVLFCHLMTNLDSADLNCDC